VTTSEDFYNIRISANSVDDVLLFVDKLKDFIIDSSCDCGFCADSVLPLLQNLNIVKNEFAVVTMDKSRDAQTMDFSLLGM